MLSIIIFFKENIQACYITKSATWMNLKLYMITIALTSLLPKSYDKIGWEVFGLIINVNKLSRGSTTSIWLRTFSLALERMVTAATYSRFFASFLFFWVIYRYISICLSSKMNICIKLISTYCYLNDNYCQTLFVTILKTMYHDQCN